MSEILDSSVRKSVQAIKCLNYSKIFREDNLCNKLQKNLKVATFNKESIESCLVVCVCMVVNPCIDSTDS